MKLLLTACAVAVFGTGHGWGEQVGEDHWAYQPVVRPVVPEGVDAVDFLVERQLVENGLVANTVAEREVLVRRAYFDLTGLPPTFEEVAAFVDDPRDDAVVWEELIERLLASPHYGERWGRHWLDVVRYGQSNGYERDDAKPYAWRYRDYVIDSFNADKPYDRFVKEQLAGDELEDGGDEGVVATGFYRLGVWDDEPDDKRAAEFEGLDDMLRATGEAFLGSTLGCARCHDHMFDPVSHEEYYGLLAFFSNVRGYDKPKEENGNAVLRKIGDGWALGVSEHGGAPRVTHVLARGEAGSPEQEAALGLPAVFGTGVPEVTGRGGTTGRRLALAEWVVDPANPLTARVMANRVWKHHFGKGLVETPNDFGGAGVAPSNPVLLDWLAAEFVEQGWSVKSLHRVIMQSPAYRRSSDGSHEGNSSADPGNQFLWRQNLRRLEAEAVRDSMLASSGNLNRKTGGEGFYPLLGGQVIAGGSRPGRGWGYSGLRERERRSVYAFVKRTMMVPMLEVFDYANTEGSVGDRPVTTVAPQALTLLNSEFVATQARVAAVAVLAEGGEGGGLKRQVRGVFRKLLSRKATGEEVAMGIGFLREQRKAQRVLLSRMQFRPEVPERLADGLRNALPAGRMLVGPEHGWEYGKGVWWDGYEGTAKADPERGPFALWSGGAVGEFRGRIGVDGAAERVGVLFGIERKGEELSGFEVVVRPKAWRWELRRLEAGKESEVIVGGELLVDLAGAGVEVRMDERGVWLGEERIGDGKEGRIGVRAWKGEASVNGLEVSAGGEVVAVPSGWPGGEAAEVERRALAELCSLVFNLNEFLYVD